MNTIQIVFSPTGGTAAAADAVTASWPEPGTTIDLTDTKLDYSAISIQPDDLVLIAMPSYGGRAPGLAMRRLSLISGNGAKCAILCVYGNRAYEDTLLELSDAAKDCGFTVIGATVAVAQHSIIPDVAAGRPDASDLQELTLFGREILEKAEKGGSPVAAQIPGSRPYKKSASMPPFIPKATRACNSCGTCAANCPTGAIDKEHPRKGDSSSCVSCMRCVKICPNDARKVNGALLAVASMALKRAAAGHKDNELYL